MTRGVGARSRCSLPVNSVHASARRAQRCRAVALPRQPAGTAYRHHHCMVPPTRSSWYYAPHLLGLGSDRARLVWSQGSLSRRWCWWWCWCWSSGEQREMPSRDAPAWHGVGRQIFSMRVCPTGSSATRHGARCCAGRQPDSQGRKGRQRASVGGHSPAWDFILACVYDCVCVF